MIKKDVYCKMKKAEKHYRENKKYNLKYFLLSFIILFTIAFIALFIVEKEIRSSQLKELEKNEKRVVKLENDYLGKEFSMILADLNYIHNAFKDDLIATANYQDIALDWQIFSTQKQIYDQIRYIDLSGDEKIRINLDQGSSYIVPEKDLQNKKDRYYVYETLELEDGAVHVSPIDLNIELGQIEEIHKPMIRFSKPLYDDEGELQGLIVLNYLAKEVLESFRNLASNSMGEIVLLNSNGYWISSDDSELEWNFMFDDLKENSFKNKYKEEWASIVDEDCQIITENGLFTSSEVGLKYKVKNNKNYEDGKIFFNDGSWYVVSSVLRDADKGFLFIDNSFYLILDIVRNNASYFLIILLISSVLAFLIYNNQKTYSKIKYYSEFDTLTNVYNRRAGLAKLNQLFQQKSNNNFVASLCFIDVNGLKQVNDNLGHQFGDELIKTVVDVIKSTIREKDFVARLGGDEFLIVFNGVDCDAAEEIWTRIKNSYDDINNKEDRLYLISVSHGIVSNKKLIKSEIDELIKIADEKMYAEKILIKKDLSIIK